MGGDTAARQRHSLCIDRKLGYIGRTERARHQHAADGSGHQPAGSGAGAPAQAAHVVGTLGDGGATAERLESEHDFAKGSVDLIFIDHDKNAYLSDLQLIIARGWLHRGSVAVADNVKFPGAPKYRAYMKETEGTQWHSVEHSTHAEYQTLLKDIVMESDYLRG